MALADVHPSVEELTAFTLGTLDEETQASIEEHVAACTACQECAANAPGDNLVELVRRVRARTGRGADTFVDPAAQVQTPVPLSAVALTVAIPPAVALSAPAELDCPEVADALPAELVNHERYRIVRLLGVGGMGAVYEAEHLVMHKTVALKVIKRSYISDADALKRFRREIRNAARLSHLNIVATTDAEDAGETHFLVMEYVDGTDLGRLVQERGPLSVDRASDYIRQAALGLQYAFERGMVHRDLKPHNLMLTLDGSVKILDFGLALFASEVADAAGLTSTGIVLGTVDYIAPEQADNAHQADIRSDIYSLGCTLYHLLAGQPPFPAGTPLQKVIAHREKKPQTLTKLRSDLPEGLMPVLERMMAKDPKHRYQTPAEVAIALEPFVLPKKHQPDRWRTRLMIATAVLAFLVAGLLGVGVYRIATDNGELVITTESDDVKVVITQGGKQVDLIDTKTDKQITLALRSGEYELALKDGGDLKISPGKITLKRGKTELATITREDNSGVAPAAKPPSGRPPDGAVAWWRADGNAKDSVGSNHGTLKGGVTFAPGVAGRAFDFNGRDAYVQVPNNANLNPGASFSVEFWVKANPSQREGEFDVIDKSHGFPGDNPPAGWAFQGATATGELNFIFGAGGGFAGASTGDSILDNQWHHIAGVYTGNSIQMYLDGVLKSMTPLTAPPANNTRDLDFGARLVGLQRPYNGLLDEVAIYDRALSPAEIKARWSALAPATKAVAEKVGEVRRIEGHKAYGAALSPNGRYALSSGVDNTIRLWDLQTGIEIRSFKGGYGGAIHAVAFLPNGREFLSCGHDGMRHWQVETETQLHYADLGCLYHVAVSPDGRLALGAHHDHTLHLWDIKNWREIRRLEGHTEQVQRVVFSADGRHALSGAADKTVRLWDVETGKELKCFKGHQGSVIGVALSPDGRLALSSSGRRGGGFGEFILWDIASEQELRRFKGHKGEVCGVAFSPDGRYALSGGEDHSVRLWEVATGNELRRFDGHQAHVWSVVFSRDGRYALSGGCDGTIRLWRLPDLPPAEKVGEIRCFGAKGHSMHRLALSPDGQRLLTAGFDGCVRYWDIAAGKEIYRLPIKFGTVYGAAISPDGTKLLSCSGDSLIHVWDAATGQEVKQLKGHTHEVIGVAVSPDGRMVASSGYDCKLRLWNLDTGELIASPGNASGGLGVAFSPDGKLIATYGQDHMVRLWDIKDRKEVRCLEGHKEWVEAGAFSRDGSRMLTGTWPSDGNGPVARPSDMKLWEVKTGKLLRTINVVPGNVHGLAISPDGRLALSCGVAGLVQLWDLESGKAIMALTGHTGPVNDVAFLPGGRTAVSVGEDCTIRLWRLPDPPPVKENP